MSSMQPKDKRVQLLIRYRKSRCLPHGRKFYDALGQAALLGEYQTVQDDIRKGKVKRAATPEVKAMAVAIKSRRL